MTTTVTERLGSIYSPHNRFRATVDMTKCRRNVAEGGRSVLFHQCTRKGKHEWIDTEAGGTYLFCKVHHPAEVAKRDAAGRAKWNKKLATEKAQRVTRGLREATDGQLQAECVRRGWTVTA